MSCTEINYKKDFSSPYCNDGFAKKKNSKTEEENTFIEHFNTQENH